MIQIIIGIIIVCIGIFTFYKYPIKNDMKQMTLGALFIILALILKRLAIMVPFLGLPSLKITLEVLPLIVAGLVLQPSYCFIVGLATDALGLLVAFSAGIPFLGFTLNSLLQAMIPCFLKMNLKDINEKRLSLIVKGIMALISLAALIYVFTLNKVTISSEVYTVSMTMKLGLLAVIILMLACLFIFMNYYQKKLKQQEEHAFHLCVLSVVAIEMTITLFLTPYWLETMYGIPFFASQFVRILKSCVMIPAGIVVVYMMYRVVKRFEK